MADIPDKEQSGVRLIGNVNLPITGRKALWGAQMLLNAVLIAAMWLSNHKVETRNADITANVTTAVTQKQAEDFAAFKSEANQKLLLALSAFDEMRLYFFEDKLTRKTRAEKQRAQEMIDLIDRTKAKLKQSSQAAPATADVPYASPASAQPHSKGN